MQEIPLISNRSILTPTTGFLGPGYTHTVNAYVGCAFAHALCGQYCYAQHNRHITRGRPWSFYGAKRNVVDAYRHDYDRLKHPRNGGARELRIYMSSVTDPYVPAEKRLQLTRSLLQAMLHRPPDVLVIQTRSPLVGRDLTVIADLSTRTTVWVCITVETDLEILPGLPRQATSPARRIATLARFRAAQVRTQATISPLLPLSDAYAFAERLNAAADRVVLDHYLLGDGSPAGLRTKKTAFPEMLRQAGFDEWTRLDKFWETVAALREVLGSSRVFISQGGFNSV